MEVQAALSEVDSCNDYALDSGAAVFPRSVNTEAEKENDVQIFWSNDRTCWQALVPSQACLWALAAAKYNQNSSRSYCDCCR